MAKLSTDFRSAVLHPRETLIARGNLGSVNAEVISPCDGCQTVTLDLRGTFNLTIEVSGTVDGVNWTPIPMRPVNVAAVSYVAAITGTAAGVWSGDCGIFQQVRARVTAYTSGTAVTTVIGENSAQDRSLLAPVTSLIATSVGAGGAAVTLTLAAPGAGLRQYLTYLSINRFATATLTAAAAPVTVTTTNLPGSLAFSFGAEALTQGSLDRWREDFAFPLASSAQNTATTIVCPTTTGVIWRVTAGYYVAP